MTAPLRTHPVLPAILAGVLTLALSCGPGGPEGGPRAAEGGVQRRELPSVRVAEIEVREMSRVLETTSKLESEREIQLMPRLSGVVLALHAEEGDAVVKDQVLAELDDLEQRLAVQDAEVALQEAKNELDRLRLAQREAAARVDRTTTALEQAVRDHERNRKLFAGEQVASTLSVSALEASQLAKDNCEADLRDAELARERTNLDLAAGETAVERAQITLDRAKLTLSHTRITAPFEGVVAKRGIKVGDSITPTTEAFVLTDVELLRCVFSRPQEERELFSGVGTSASEGRLALSATADAYPGRVFEGWIERVSPTIDPQSGQFRVTGRLQVEQDSGRVRLLPGMLVRLRIVTERHPDALVVPKRALEREGERRYVLVVEEGQVRRTEVDEGFADGEWVEVLPTTAAALEPGTPVVVVGGRDLADGDAVLVDDAHGDVPASTDDETFVEDGAGADAKEDTSDGVATDEASAESEG